MKLDIVTLAVLLALGVGGQRGGTLAADLVVQSTAIGGGSLQLMCPDRLTSPRPRLLIHFHGAPEVTQSNFQRANLPGVLVTINFNGLSSAYSTPFREESGLFQCILEIASERAGRITRANSPVEWGRISLSSFSAGYGAVREILKSPEDFERIAGILAADSIYASLADGAARRVVDPVQMRDFRRFAELAAQEKKIFVVTHSYLETPYASTFETADDLLAYVGVSRVAADEPGSPGLVPRNLARKGNLHVIGYEGVDGEAHMQHLRQIGQWWPQLYCELKP